MASEQNYTLGRGTLHFARWPAGKTSPGGIPYVYFGNTPAISMTSESQTLDHYSSDHGVRTKDESVLLQLDRKGTFTTDSIRPNNLALLLLGESQTVARAAQTAPQTQTLKARADTSFQLGETAANPNGARFVTVAADGVKTTGANPVTLVPGDDYLLDAERGLITIMDGSSNIFAAADEVTLAVEYTEEANERTLIIGGTDSIEGSLKYISDNPTGLQYDYLWPWVKLSPNGDFELKGDDWQSIGFNFEVLTASPLSPVYVNGQARKTAG